MCVCVCVCVCVHTHARTHTHTHIDFEPYETDTPGGGTALTNAPSVRLQYSHMASVDLLSNPVWKQVFLFITQLVTNNHSA
jgi:hypothetical protein